MEMGVGEDVPAPCEGLCTQEASTCRLHHWTAKPSRMCSEITFCKGSSGKRWASFYVHLTSRPLAEGQGHPYSWRGGGERAVTPARVFASEIHLKLFLPPSQ